MYIKISEEGLVEYSSKTQALDMEVADDFFYTYPSFCWTVIDGELVLNADADAVIAQIETDRLAAEILPLKIQTCKEIDQNTEDSIIALVGDLEKQANMQSKVSRLIHKEIATTITPEETTELETYLDLLNQVETLINTGNAKEESIMACTTLEEYNTIKDSL